MSRRAAPLVVALVLAVGSSAVSCSDADDEERAGPATTDAPGRRRVKVQPAALEGPITRGEFSGPVSPRPPDLESAGYVEAEFFASGTATSYRATREPAADGRWDVEPAAEAPYRTRLVVRRPADAARFSGTVLVEWLNVTVVEAGPDWTYGREAIVDAGAAWVGVSVQALGVVGGQSLLSVDDARAQDDGGLRGRNPERYGSLQHPGDAFAFDIYSQIGAALRDPGDAPVLGGATARRVVAIGESQSAGYLTGYLNGVHAAAQVFDGFFVHSRGSGAALPGGVPGVRGDETAYRIRDDLDVPVMVFETETDVGPLLRFGLVGQEDADRLRVWEVPGTAHADAYLVGGTFPVCPYPVNSGPQHYVLKAALAATMRWVEDAVAPPRADRIETAGDGTDIVRDEHGNARGGIRTPSVDVPVATLSGESEPGAPVLCALFGKTAPFDAATLRSLYTSKEAYVDAFEASLDEVIDAGFVRRADRAQYLAEARAVEWPV